MFHLTRGFTNGVLIILCVGFGFGSGLVIIAALLLHQFGVAASLLGYPALFYAVHQQRGLINRLRSTIVKSTERAYHNGLRERGRS